MIFVTIECAMPKRNNLVSQSFTEPKCIEWFCYFYQSKLIYEHLSIVANAKRDIPAIIEENLTV